MLKKLFIVSVILLFPVSVYAFHAESSVYPDRLVKSRGKVMYNYNIQEIQRDTDNDGTPDTTFYRYDYVVIDPPVTKGKILEALENADQKITEQNAANVEAEYKSRKANKAALAAKKTTPDSVKDLWERVEKIEAILGIK